MHSVRCGVHLPAVKLPSCSRYTLVLPHADLDVDFLWFLRLCSSSCKRLSCTAAGLCCTTSPPPEAQPLDLHASACPQVTLTPQIRGVRVPFEERDWRSLSLGQGFSQLVRGKTGQRKVAGFTLLRTEGARGARLPGPCL